ncbi:MAG: hypothetical protein Q9227_003550 [Pyrenula ochraceoflavens]
MRRILWEGLNALLRRDDSGSSDSDSSDETSNPSTGSATGDQILKLVADPFKQNFQNNAVWAALATNIGITLAIAVLFSIMRPRHNVVYAPKMKIADEKHAPPPIGKGVLAWIKPIQQTKEDILAEKVGLDATVFLRFMRMLRNMFLILSIVGCGVMIPVNVLGRNKKISSGLNTFAVMTPLYLFGNLLWSHVICAWAFDLIVVYFLWYNYRKVRRLRRNYFQSPEYQKSLHARTVMVTDVPTNLRTDEGIMRVTDDVNPTGVLPRATVGRNVKDLPDMIKKHEEGVLELESVLSKYLKNPDNLPAQRPTMRAKGGRVDSIDYLTSKIRELEIQIKDVRDRVDKRDAMPYGFASWEQIDQAHAVAYAARKKRPQGTVVQLAPRPNDLIWENLPLSTAARRTKRVWINVWVALLTLIWLPLNAGIAIFLSNLSNLGLVWKGFQKQLEKNHGGWAIVQGIAAPAVTSVVYLVLPIIFRRLSMLAGDQTKTSRERHVIHNLYAFFVFNNLVIFSIFSALWGFIVAVINKKDQGVWDAVKAGDFWVRFITSLCTVSPFWITWLLQRNLGAATDLAQLLHLVTIWFQRMFMHPTPRQSIQWTAPPSFDYASYYNYFLFYATVALCFATLQPIVLPVTAAYFALDSWLKKYLLLYVFITKTESGGQYWRILFNRVVFATVLANVTVACVLKAHGNWVMVAAIAPLPFLMIGFKYYCMKAFDDDLEFYVRSGMRDMENLQAAKTGAKTAQRVAHRFGNPALYKPLITPMVHAKAQHLLSQVYSGRMSEDNARNSYSEYAMDNMTPAMPGMKQGSNAPFEVVPESQLDFAYFKNREDFRDETGSITGRTDPDAMTIRSNTPAPYMARQWSSPGSSRDTSPSPDRGRQKFMEIDPSLRNHPAFRDHSMASGHSDMRGGLSTPYSEDHERLLGHAQAAPYSDGGQAGFRRWDTGSTQEMGYGRAEPDSQDPSNYDYFRRGRV